MWVGSRFGHGWFVTAGFLGFTYRLSLASCAEISGRAMNDTSMVTFCLDHIEIV